MTLDISFGSARTSSRLAERGCMLRMRLRCLGDSVIEIGAHRLTPTAEYLFPTALLLIMEPERRISRIELIGLLWPDAAVESAQHRCRQVLYRLRAFGVEIVSEGGQVSLAPDSFSSEHTALFRPQSESEVVQLAEQVAGAFLPGVTGAFSTPYAEWLETQRAIVNSGIRRILVTAIQHTREHGDWRATERLAHKCLGIDPLNEEATLAAAEVLALQGSKANALELLDGYVREVGALSQDVAIPAQKLRTRIRAISETRDWKGPSLALIGRQAEQGLLQSAVTQTLHGSGGGLLIWGEAGIGKTSLASYASRYAELRGARAIRLERSVPDARRPLGLLVDLATHLVQLRGAAGCSPDALHFLTRLTASGDLQVRPSAISRDADLLAYRIREAIVEVLEAVLAEQPLLLVVEDASNIDALSARLLHDLISWFARKRLLVILTARERYKVLSEAKEPAGVRELFVGPLAIDDCHLLADATLHDSKSKAPAEFVQWSKRVAAGNPFFLIELLKEDTHRSSAYEIPKSLSELLAVQVANLPSVSIRVLQVAALLGRAATVKRVESVVRYERLELLDALEDLERRRMLAVADGKLLCRHELLAEAVVRHLTEAGRRLLHQYIARVLETELSYSSSSTLLWDCAEHWRQADDDARALRVVRACARHLLEIGVPDEAAALLQRAYTYAASPEERSAVRAELVYALHVAGQWRRLLSVLQSDLLAGELNGVHAPHDETELLVIEAEWRAAHSSGASLVERLIGCTRASASSAEHKLRATALGLMIATNHDDRDAVRVLYENATDSLREATDTGLVALVELIHVTAVGEPSEIVEAAEKLVTSARSSENMAELARNLYAAANALRLAGEFVPAASYAKQAWAIATKHHLTTLAYLPATVLAALNIHSGDLRAAKEWTELASNWVRASGDQGAETLVAGQAAQIAFWEGSYDEARVRLLELEGALAERPTARSRGYAAALRILLALRLERRSPSPGDVASLVDLHRTISRTAPHDFIAYAICEAYASMGERELSSTFLRSVVTAERRKRGALHFALAGLAKQEGVSL